MLDKVLLQLLADGEFHSGEHLGQALGISRAAIWKRLQKLKAQGLDFEQVRGRGYRLRQGLSLLDEAALRAELRQPLALEIYDELSSTNDRGLDCARHNNSVDALAILAERQTAGRGRLGRCWQSPLGQNLYVTLVWPFAGGVQLAGLSLVVGLVLAETLSANGLVGAGVKWPNDIHVKRRKLAGILVELAGNLELSPVAVIGIGVNGQLSEAALGAIDQPATDWVTETGMAMDRSRVAGQLLANLQTALAVFAAQGFSTFEARWNHYDICRGQALWLHRQGKKQAVEALGVGDDGSLRVLRDGQEEWLHGGEVSIRWQ